MILSPETIIEAHRLLKKDDESSRIECINFILDAGKEKTKIDRPDVALAMLRGVLQIYLDANKYTEAALLLWGDNGFDPKPRAVKMIWDALMNYDKIMLIGAAGQGKSYTPAKWAVLDYIRDPKYTTIKVVSVSGKHGEGNLMAAVVEGFTEASIPLLPSENLARRWIGIDPRQRHASIELVAISGGEDNKATLQGFHPRPRPYHPQFGIQTRIRIFLDEAEKIAPTAWAGVDNVLSHRDSLGTIKVCAGTNPEDKETPFGQRAMPKGGWGTIDIETSETWESDEGWNVVRLDAAKSENVVQKKKVNGMLTYEGFQDFVKMGLNSARYYTFGRGFYPEQGADRSIIPAYVLAGSIGTYIFEGQVTNIGSLDPAFELGGDDAVFTTGRTGLAIGFRSPTGEVKNFDSAKKVIQIEQQFTIEKGNSIDMGDAVIKLCKDLQIRPENFCMDRTGNGTGLHDYLIKKFGGILGIQWGEGATDKKILEEDTRKAEDLYLRIVTEMWFAFARWLEFGYIKFAPMMNTQRVFSELGGRRYKYQGIYQAAESKDSFKTRTGGKSCDYADSSIMLPHLLRMRTSTRGAMFNESPLIRDSSGFPIWPRENSGVVDKLEYVDFEL